MLRFTCVASLVIFKFVNFTKNKVFSEVIINNWSEASVTCNDNGVTKRFDIQLKAEAERQVR